MGSTFCFIAGIICLVVLNVHGHRLDLIHWNSPDLRDNSTSLLQHLSVTAAKSVSSLPMARTDGAFVADMYVGTPRQRMRMVVDTGSDLTWFKLSGIINSAGKNNSAPIYDIAASSSYAPVRCTDAACQGNPALFCSPNGLGPFDCGTCVPGNKSTQCVFFYMYGSAQVLGYMMRENLGFSDKSERFRYAMGAATEYSGSLESFTGIFGLSQGDKSILKQLGWESFSYCLVDVYHSNYTSPLFLGKNAAPPLPADSETQSTPLLGLDLYQLDLHGIYVGDVWIGATDATRSTIIDSGTTLTYLLNATAVDTFVNLTTGVPYLGYNSSEGLPCFNVSGVRDYKFPKIKFRFSNNAVMEPPLENYMLFENDLACLTIAPSFIDVNIIGNIMQQNYHVRYDLKASRLSFRPAQCDKF